MPSRKGRQKLVKRQGLSVEADVPENEVLSRSLRLSKPVVQVTTVLLVHVVVTGPLGSQNRGVLQGENKKFG